MFHFVARLVLVPTLPRRCLEARTSRRTTTPWRLCSSPSAISPRSVPWRSPTIGVEVLGLLGLKGGVKSRVFSWCFSELYVVHALLVAEDSRLFYYDGFVVWETYVTVVQAASRLKDIRSISDHWSHFGMPNPLHQKSPHSQDPGSSKALEALKISRSGEFSHRNRSVMCLCAACFSNWRGAQRQVQGAFGRILGVSFRLPGFACLVILGFSALQKGPCRLHFLIVLGLLKQIHVFE